MRSRLTIPALAFALRNNLVQNSSNGNVRRPPHGSIGWTDGRVAIVGWYRCTCGFMTEATPRIGDSIASVSHLHRATRLDGTSSIVRMEEIQAPLLDRAPACAVEPHGAHPAESAVTTLSSLPQRTKRPQRRAA